MGYQRRVHGLMAQWYRLLGEKNRLVRREQELMVESKQLELVEKADREECELARLAGSLDKLGGDGTTAALDRLARIAEQREQLEEMLARDRERYAREDTEISNKMREQGISS